MPQALFDLDGTLCDPREGIVHGFRHALDLARRPWPGDAAITPLIGLPLTDCFGRLGFAPGAEREEAAHHFQAFFEARGFAEARLFGGVEALLRRLRAAGWGLAIASAKPTFAVEFVCEGLGILRFFDSVHGCAPQDLTPQKGPIVGAALQARGWDPAGTVMVGDRAQDRDAARAHGLRFIAAGWGFAEAGELDGCERAESVAELGARLLQAAPR